MHRGDLIKGKVKQTLLKLRNPKKAGRIYCPAFLSVKMFIQTLKKGRLMFHPWTAAHKKLGIFMKPNCAQMLIFKQKYQVRLLQLAAQLWVQPNRLAPVQRLG